MPSYQLTIISKSTSTESQTAAVQSKLESIIKDHKGEIVYSEDWGKRRLAYNIQGENKANYNYYAFTGNTDTVNEIERNLRINETVMRYLSVKVDDEENIEKLKEPSPIIAPRERKPVPEFRESRD